MPARLALAALAALGATTTAPPAPTVLASPAQVPVTHAPMPRFPYLRWPAEVVPRAKPVERAVGHFRFWDGTALQDVEGRAFLVTLVRRDRNRAFDEDRIHRTVDADLTRMGGVRIAAGRVPHAVLDTINAGDRLALAPGLGDVRNSSAETWMIRRTNRQIWVQYTGNAAQISIAVVATRPD